MDFIAASRIHASVQAEIVKMHLWEIEQYGIEPSLVARRAEADREAYELRPMTWQQAQAGRDGESRQDSKLTARSGGSCGRTHSRTAGHRICEAWRPSRGIVREQRSIALKGLHRAESLQGVEVAR